MNKNLSVLIAFAVLMLGAVAIFEFSPIGTDLTWKLSNEGKWLLPLVGIAAVVDSINPCAFSILLLTIAFLFGLGRARSQVLKIGVAYILGIYVVYFLIGLGILHVLHFFNTPHFMAKVGAVFLFLWGAIVLINEFFPAFPVKLRVPHVAHHKMAVLMERTSAPAAFFLGGLVGVCEFPCTGGPYLMVLGLLHDSATYIKGVGYLIFYNLIFILPLIIILLLASTKQVVERVQAWRKKETKAMRLWAGLAMVALGIFIFFL